MLLVYIDRTKTLVMKFVPALIVAGFLFISFSSISQVVSKDSINALNQKKEIIELEKLVNTQKLKLASLENSQESKRRDMESAQKGAQKSADENAEIAFKLSSDPNDRKLARKAKRAAKSAKKDARQSRKATGDFEALQKDIETLRKKLADNEQKLSSMSAI
jgi:hypothetical protein